jgi:hypothetical protein
VVSSSGRQLAVFAIRSLQNVTLTITITAMGMLVPLGSVGGIPAGSTCLAAN